MAQVGGRGSIRRGIASLMAVATVGAVALAVAQPAVRASTFPGHNGLLLFSQNTGSDPSRSIIVIMAADGSNRQELTDGATDDTSPSWSADGRRIVFARSDNQASERRSQIYVMSADGSDVTRVSADTASSYYDPTFAPDRDVVVAAKRGESRALVEIDLATSTERVLVASSPNSYSSPTFSPDGTRIAVYRYEAGPSSYDVRTVDRDGGDERILGSAYSRSRLPCWFPDGSALLVSMMSGGRPGPNPALWRIGSDGTDLVHLTDDVMAGCPSPDGTLIAGIDHSYHVVVANADGSGATRVGDTSGVTELPEWQPVEEPAVPPTTSTIPRTEPTLPAAGRSTAAVAVTPRYTG